MQNTVRFIRACVSEQLQTVSRLTLDCNYKRFQLFTFLDAIDHKLTELVAETLYFFFVLFHVYMTIFRNV